MKKRILISVTDKNGIEKFKQLADLGWIVISTGGTLKYLEAHGIPCTHIEEVTHFPEMMDGRLKTLHPNVFGGILAKRNNIEHMSSLISHGIEPIDIIVVNFYDFESDPRIENIDIGGPSLLRAAAKNGQTTVAVIDPNDYDMIIREIIGFDEVRVDARKLLAIKVLESTSKYDLSIATWMKANINLHPEGTNEQSFFF